MPIYQVSCNNCGAQSDIFRSVAEYDNLPECCGVKTHRVICAPMVIADIQPYQSMMTGEMIDGRRDHKEHLKKHGVVEVGNDLNNAKPKPYEPAKGLKETIARQVYSKLS